MNPRTMFLASLVLVPALIGGAFLASPAAGDSKGDKALAEAVKKGQALYKKSWKAGAKSCFACHVRGPNKLTGRRLKAYPKYDKAMRRVVSAQEKINQMIKGKSGGQALALGHEDLTALEAYISTLK